MYWPSYTTNDEDLATLGATSYWVRTMSTNAFPIAQSVIGPDVDYNDVD
jgi:hypothetical protein